MKKKEIRSRLLKSGITFIIFLFSFLSLPAEVTVEQAVKNGIKLSKNYKNHILESRSLKLAKENARVQKRFTVDSGLSYLFRSQQMEINMPDMNLAPGVSIPGFHIVAGAKHNYDVKLSLTQPIFTGFILSNAVKLESIKLAVEKNRLLLSRIEIAGEIKTSYFNYRLLQNRLTALEILIEQLRLHHRKMQNYYREELIRKSDLLETEAKIYEQELNLRDLQNQLEAEKINFKSLCGFEIAEVEKNYSEKSSDLNRALSEFKSSHPVLKTLEKQAAGFNVREKIVAGGYLPRIGGFAEIHYGRPGIDFFKNEWSFYFQGGFSVDFRIFDWNKKKRDIDILRYGSEKIKNETAAFITEAETHFKQLFAARAAAGDKLETVKKLHRIAAEDITLKEGLLEEQQIDNIDYLSALTREETYISLQNTIRTQVELLNVKINQLSGTFQEER